MAKTKTRSFLTRLLSGITAISSTVCMLPAMPGLDAAAATENTYELWICDTQVTESNASDILGDGVFSYDAAAYKLTVSGNYTSSSRDPVITNDINNLTINVASNSNLTANNSYGLLLRANTKITGQGKLTATGSTGIQLYNANLTAVNANLDISGNYGILNLTDSKVTFNHTRAHVTGTEVAYLNYQYSNKPILNECMYTTPYNSDGIEMGSYRNNDGYLVEYGLLDNGSPLKGFEITPINSYYGLTVGGVDVNDVNASDILGNGKFAYNALTNTLTLSGDYSCTSTTGDRSFIRNEIQDLTIKTISDTTISGYSYGIYSDCADITVTGAGKLTIKASSNAIATEFSNLTIRNANLDLEGYYGLSGAPENSELLVINSTIYAKGSEAAIFDFEGGVSFEDCDIVSPSCTYYDDENLYDANDEIVKEVLIRQTPIEKYDLKVGGVQVTDKNASDILGNGIFSFNANTKTLTIKGSYTNNSIGNIIDNEINGLTVLVAGDSTIVLNNCCIYTNHADMKIIGKDSSKKMIINTLFYPIIADNGSTLTIKDLDLVVSGETGIIGSEGSNRLDLNNVTLHAIGTFAAINNFTGDITLNNCVITSPQGAQVSGGSILDANGNLLEEVMITPVKTYPLTVAGVQVTELNAADVLGDGNISFDTGSYTLRLNGNYTLNHDKNFIISSVGGLNIVVASDTTVSGCIHGIFAYESNISIFGNGKLTIDADSFGIELMSSTLRVNQTQLDLKGLIGIYGDTTSKLFATNSMIHAQGTAGGISDINGGIQLQDCLIVKPEGGSISGGAIVDANGNTAKEVLIQSTVKYSLYVGGTQVTELNASDILGDRKFSYDPVAKKLTVKGNFTTDQYVSFISSRIHGLTVYVASDSSVTCGADGIYSKNADITITGPGKLTLNSTGPNAYGIDMEGSSLTVKEADIDVKGVFGIIGDNDDEILTVIDSRIRAEGTSGAICNFGDGITLTDCQITSPEGAVIANGSVNTANGGFAKEVLIESTVKQYDLYIAGTQVSDRNASDILGNGVFSYDAASNTLTVNGDYTYNANDNLVNIYCAGLKIKVASDSTITCKGACFASMNLNYKIIGPGKLTIHAKEFPIFNVGGTVIVQNTVLNLTGRNAFYGGGNANSGIYVVNSAIHAEGTDCAINGFNNVIQLQNCFIGSPEDAVIENGIVCNADGSKAKTVDIYPGEAPVITKHPEDTSGCIGDKVKFSVEATGNGLVYQWQYFNTETNEWENTGLAGNKTPTLTVSVIASRNGMKYHCVVKDNNGVERTSEAATLTVNPKIVKQPANASGCIGEQVQFTVEATGIGLVYQWQYFNTATNKWENTGLAGNKTATLTVTVTSARNGMKYHCIVKDNNGTKLTSAAATLTVNPKIVTQPADASGCIGEQVQFTVEATGVGLIYQWQYYNTSTNKWENTGLAGNKTPTLTVTVTSARNGMKYHCIVKDASGTKLTSASATLTVNPKIVTQPADASGCIGDKVQFSVEATGISLVYQWQYFNTATNKWENTGLAGNKTATLTVTVTSARNGMKYHCIVKDASGTKLTSAAATLTVNPKIVTQPADASGCIGDKVQFTVEATGIGLVYQWQYFNTATNKWENTGLTGNKTATLTVTVTSVRNGMKYHCIVKDIAGTKLTSAAATLTVNPKIVTQPADASGTIGEQVQFTVEATGIGLVYQWQYYNTSTKKWENTGLTGNQTPTLTVSVTAGRNNMKYHCIVKDSAGNKLTSTAATLTVK